MDRVFNSLLLTALVLVAACTNTDAVPPDSETSAGTSPSDWIELRHQHGRVIFEATCADCHGAKGTAAPLIGDQDSWSGRSPLWSAVLFEHAKNGYLAMPAKGGNPSLSESDVEAAGEYMLTETFPDLPRD